jgi:hypothetical protein
MATMQTKEKQKELLLNKNPKYGVAKCAAPEIVDFPFESSVLSSPP